MMRFCSNKTNVKHILDTQTCYFLVSLKINEIMSLTI